MSPQFLRCKAEPSDIALAVAATISTWHAADWLAVDAQAEVKTVVDRLYDREPRIEYLHAAANGLKHRRVERTPWQQIGLQDFMTHPFAGALSNGARSEEFALPLGFLFVDGARWSSHALIELGITVMRAEAESLS